MGSDLVQSELPLLLQFISIHAPAWGATQNDVLTNKTQEFQSTLPHGERRATTSTTTPSSYFNPRSRMGSDPSNATARTARTDFNPRSRMGSDLPHTLSCLLSPRFQSTLPQGERLPPTCSACRTPYFNPRSRMGVFVQWNCGRLSIVFQSS